MTLASPVSCFRPWSAPGRHIMRSERSRRANLRRVVRLGKLHSTTHGLIGSRVPATGPRRSGTRPCPELGYLLGPKRQPPLHQRNSVPSTHMRCRTTASSLPAPPWRASRRGAWPHPWPSASASRPGRMTEHHGRRLVERGPHHPVANLADPAVTSVSPDWYRFGVSPKWAPTAGDR